ncbi:class I SAM-dependent methyltransferase [Dyella sp. Tek66A03]|uniref:class I SAM-dependent methyltransferase n=1 Tax=Dyella sp. Tek66A03 TaxID=3458298 RepID=UPI00403EB223
MESHIQSAISLGARRLRRIVTRLGLASSLPAMRDEKSRHGFSPSKILMQADLWNLTLNSFAECQCALETHAERFQARRSIENEIQGQLGSRKEAFLPGYCWVCRSVQAFTYDFLHSDSKHVNWRERLICPTCQLNNRLRLSVQVFECSVKGTNPSIYITEQVTPMAAYLAKHYPSTVMSEYLGPEFSSGAIDSRGIRHEDVTALSFEDATFNYILSFDVLEHVPDYRAALREFSRTLKPGGKVLLSVPFGLLYDRNLIRARIGQDGSIEHILPAEYHGDPVDPQGGVLCYYHFGWELLEDFRAAGFSDAKLSIMWSLEYGHIGNEQILIVAQK